MLPVGSPANGKEMWDYLGKRHGLRDGNKEGRIDQRRIQEGELEVSWEGSHGCKVKSEKQILGYLGNKDNLLFLSCNSFSSLRVNHSKIKDLAKKLSCK